MHTPGSGSFGLVFILIVQIVFIIVFGFATNYDENLLPKNQTSGIEQKELIQKYPSKIEILGCLSEKNPNLHRQLF